MIRDDTDEERAYHCHDGQAYSLRSSNWSANIGDILIFNENSTVLDERLFLNEIKFSIQSQLN